MTYEEADDELWRRLLEACDERLQSLFMADWDRRDMDLDDLDNEDDRKTAHWLDQCGVNSVNEIFENMIWTLQSKIGVEDLGRAFDNIRVYSQEGNNGYKLPVLAILEDDIENGEDIWVEINADGDISYN